jgi:excisionase family DNA binding protein
MEKILRIGQAADVLRMCPRTVAKLVDSKELGGYSLPGSRHRRVPLDALEAFIAKHRMPASFVEDARRLAGSAEEAA